MRDDDIAGRATARVRMNRSDTSPVACDPVVIATAVGVGTTVPRPRDGTPDPRSPHGFG